MMSELERLQRRAVAYKLAVEKGEAKRAAAEKRMLAAARQVIRLDAQLKRFRRSRDHAADQVAAFVRKERRAARGESAATGPLPPPAEPR